MHGSLHRLASIRTHRGLSATGADGVLIMVVDDEPDHRTLARRVMERGGHTVLAARDGLEALELLAEHDIELVVTDLYMPHMTGLELAAQIHAEYPDVVCVVWSAVEDAQQGDVLPKNVMLLNVDGWMEQHAGRDQTQPDRDGTDARR